MPDMQNSHQNMTDFKSPMGALLAREDWGEHTARMDAFRATPHYPLLLAALDGLQYDALYMSHVHGIGHVERTMLHGAMCAAAEPLETRCTELKAQLRELVGELRFLNMTEEELIALVKEGFSS